MLKESLSFASAGNLRFAGERDRRDGLRVVRILGRKNTLIQKGSIRKNIFRVSSAVEQCAVNALAVGSIPTLGDLKEKKNGGA